MRQGVIFANIFGYIAVILLTALATYFVFSGQHCTKEETDLQDTANAIYGVASVTKAITEKKFYEVLERKDLSCYYSHLADKFVLELVGSGANREESEKKNALILTAAAKFIRKSEAAQKYELANSWVACEAPTNDEKEKCVEKFFNSH